MTFTNFIKRPVLSTVISIFFVLLGTIGLVSLPIEQYPNIAPPTISVMANYPGADAQTVLNSVVTLLEESINGHFPTVRWKLFDQQINGGMAETCICMVPCGGCYVPYPTANTASQLTADLEIIDALSKRYDTRLPVFFDNRERVNVLPPVDGQLITLAVTTDDPLKVEIVKA